MPRNIFSFLVGCALIVAIAIVQRVSHAAGNRIVERELMQSERNWCAATVKNDVAALGAILADDIIDVWPNGQITTKAQDLADVQSHKTSTCEVDMMQVRVYGNAGIVVGRLTVKSTAFNGRIRFTDTYVRRDGRWQVVLSSGAAIK
jgi:ketosteroid isomerase-like protein